MNCMPFGDDVYNRPARASVYDHVYSGRDEDGPSEPIGTREMFCTIPEVEDETFKAVRYNDLTMIVRKINEGFDVNTPHVEAPSNKIYTIRDMNRMVRQLRLKEYSLLHVAVVHGDIETIKLLLDHGATINAIDVNQLSPLSIACATQRADVVQLLLKHGADPNIQSVSGQTPLIFAVRANNLNIVNQLIKTEADLNLADYKGSTPLFHCFDIPKNINCLQITRALIAGGCQVDFETKQGATALMMAMGVGKLEIAEILLEADANLYHKDKNGRNVFSMAHGPKTAMFLINRGAACDEPDASGLRPLDKVISNGHLGMMRLLLSADVQRSAAIQEHERVVKMCDQVPSFQSWLSDELNNPRDLKRLCRQTIRTVLSPESLIYIDTFPIPRLMKDFLLVKDFDLSTVRSIQNPHPVYPRSFLTSIHGKS